MEKTETWAYISLLLLQFLSIVPSCLEWSLLLSGVHSKSITRTSLPGSTGTIWGCCSILCLWVKWRLCVFLLFILFRDFQFLLICWEENSVICKQIQRQLSGVAAFARRAEQVAGGRSPVPYLVLICPYISIRALSQHITQDSFLDFGPTCTRDKLSWFLAWFTFKRMSLCWFNLIPHQFLNPFPTGRLQLFWLCWK